MKIETIYAIMLPDNYRAISLMKKMGFSIAYATDGTVKGILNLKEEETTLCKPSENAEKSSSAAIGENPAETKQAMSVGQ
jgi:hypothetical protein